MAERKGRKPSYTLIAVAHIMHEGTDSFQATKFADKVPERLVNVVSIGLVAQAKLNGYPVIVYGKPAGAKFRPISQTGAWDTENNPQAFSAVATALMEREDEETEDDDE